MTDPSLDKACSLSATPSEPEAVTELLSELRTYQEPTGVLIPKLAFRALCREILDDEIIARKLEGFLAGRKRLASTSRV
ncbi:hypothetical protein Q9189_000323 [Teloschistes chrysophthalmus]